MSASLATSSRLLTAMATASLLLATALLLAPPVLGASLPCGPCTCDVSASGQVTANCSYRNLPEIPDSLPANTSVLLLAGNAGLRSLLEGGALAKMSALVSLDVSGCGLVNVSNASLASQGRLQQLDLSYNPGLGLGGVTALVRSLPKAAPLSRLAASRVVPELTLGVSVTQELAEALRGRPLAELELDENQIEMVCDGVLESLPPTLTALSVRRNRLRPGLYLFSLASLPGLARLNAEEQFARLASASLQDRAASWGYADVPTPSETTCAVAADSCRSPDSIARTLQLMAQVYTGSFNFSLPPALTYLNVSGNQMSFPLKAIRVQAPNLTELDASGNTFGDFHGPISGLESVQNLTLSNNSALNLGADFFSGFPQVRRLFLQSNKLGLWQALTEAPKFGSLKKLQYLDLSGNYIMNMHRNLFDGLNYLEVLELYFNSITKWDVDISCMQNLTTLDIHLNSLEDIPKDLRDQLDFISKKHTGRMGLNLSKNLYKCSCATVDSWRWLRDFIRDHNVTLSNTVNLTCTAPNTKLWYLGNETDLQTAVDRLSSDCVDNSVAVGVLVTVFVFVLLFVVLGVLYYNRRRLRRYLALAGGPEEERGLLDDSAAATESSARRGERTASRAHVQSAEA